MRSLVRSIGLVALVTVVLGAGCSTPKAHHKKHIKPPTDEGTPAAAGPKDSHFDEVKKAAAEQLQCPVEQINVVCLRRDSDGECISVRADGCDKSYEYQFGDT